MKGSPLEAMFAMGGRDHPEALLQQASGLEKKLVTLLESNGSDSEAYNGVRRKLRKHYAQLILWHYEFAQKHDVETALWKNVYYRQLEILRRRIRATQLALNTTSRPDELTKQSKKDAVAFLNLLDSANYFYKELMKQLQKRHKSIGAVGHPSETPVPVQRTPVQNMGFQGSKPMNIHGMCGRILTILGDLTRYRGEVSQKLMSDADSTPPEWFYEQAARVWPQGGQALNQLAVMALHKRKHLQSAYYYARALSSKEFFPQAHGNLVQLWERNQRAYSHLANDAGETIGHNRHLSMAMEGLALRFEKVMMMVYEGQDGDDFNTGVEDVVADLVSVMRAPEFFNECKHCSPSSNQMLHIAMLAIFGVYSTSPSFPGNQSGLNTCRSQGPQTQRNAYALFLQVASVLVSAVGHSSYGQDVSPLLSGPVFIILSWMAENMKNMPSIDDELHAGFWSAAADMAALLRSRGAAPPPLAENQRPIPEEVELQGFLPLADCFECVDFLQPPWEGELLDAACRSKLWSKCCNLATMLHDLIAHMNRGPQVLLAMKCFISAVRSSLSTMGLEAGIPEKRAAVGAPPEHLDLADLSSITPISAKGGRHTVASFANAMEGQSERTTSLPLKMDTARSTSPSVKVDTGSTAYHSAVGTATAMEDEEIEGEIVMYQASMDHETLQQLISEQRNAEVEKMAKAHSDSGNQLARTDEGQRSPAKDFGSGAIADHTTKSEQSCWRRTDVDVELDSEPLALTGEKFSAGHPCSSMGQTHAGNDGNQRASRFLPPAETDVSKGRVNDGKSLRLGGSGSHVRMVLPRLWACGHPGGTKPDDKHHCDCLPSGTESSCHAGSSGRAQHMFQLTRFGHWTRHSDPRGQKMGKGHHEVVPVERAVGESLEEPVSPSAGNGAAKRAGDVLDDVFRVNQKDLAHQLSRLRIGKFAESDSEPYTSAPEATAEDRREQSRNASSSAALRDGAFEAPLTPLKPEVQLWELPGLQVDQQLNGGLPGTTDDRSDRDDAGRDDLINQLSELYMNLGATTGCGGFDPIVGPCDVQGHTHNQTPLPAFRAVPRDLLQLARQPHPTDPRYSPLLQGAQAEVQTAGREVSIPGNVPAIRAATAMGFPNQSPHSPQGSAVGHPGVDPPLTTTVAGNQLRPGSPSRSFLGLEIDPRVPSANKTPSLACVLGEQQYCLPGVSPPMAVERVARYGTIVGTGLVRAPDAPASLSEGGAILVAQHPGPESAASGPTQDSA